MSAVTTLRPTPSLGDRVGWRLGPRKKKQEKSQNETEAMTLIQNRHRHKHCLDPRLGRRLRCLSGTHLVPRQLHHVPFWLSVWLGCSLSRTKAAGRFPPQLPHHPPALCTPGCLPLPFPFFGASALHTTPSCPNPPDLKSQRLRRFLCRFYLVPKRKLYLASGSLPLALCGPARC